MAKAKILLVDDEVEFASTLAERLNIRGYETSTVYAADAVLEQINNNVPDIVILDLKMPGASGVDILKDIKNLNPGIEVILLTGHGSDQCNAECQSGGAFDYIMKPVEIEGLTMKIDAALKKKQK
ncbi:MAG TPA: response regulator [Dissulfurispiraceae bacterium]|nr:response regulator [Dissulfurispiraceae bacterium]